MKTYDSTALLGPIELVRLAQINTILQCRFHPTRWHRHSARKHAVDIPASMLQAVPERLSEFVAGRVLAREFLTRTGSASAIGYCDSSRTPQWPPGYLGSISHYRGLAVCTVGSTSQYAGLGIDIEQWLSAMLAIQVEQTVWDQAEADLFLRSGWRHEHAVTTAFSAKESFFKALYPQVNRFFGFSAAAVCAIDGNEQCGQLHIRLTEQLSVDYPVGTRFIVDFKKYDMHVLTGLALTHLSTNIRSPEVEALS